MFSCKKIAALAVAAMAAAVLTGGILKVLSDPVEVRADEPKVQVPALFAGTDNDYQKHNYLTPTDDGWMRVVEPAEGDVIVEYYDKDFQLLNKRTIAAELDFFELFYAGKDCYYNVFGRNNTKEKNDLEVIRVVKYSKDWKRLGAAKITSVDTFGGEVGYPFHYGTTELCECDGSLYLVTGHRGYVDPSVGQGHQGFLMYEIKIDDMNWNLLSCNLWHSFSQHIVAPDSDNIYVYEESEGSRCTTLGKVIEAENWYGEKYRTLSRLEVFPYGGQRTSAWAIATFATADDVELSSANILGIGSSIDQSRYEDKNYQKKMNIYLTVTNRKTFSEKATATKWLTTDGDTSSYSHVRLIKINNNRFCAMWDKQSTGLSYCFIDGAGNKLSKICKRSDVFLPGSDPVYHDGKISFCFSGSAHVTFCSIDAGSGKLSLRKYDIAGENALWSLKDGVLTITGTGAVTDSFTNGLPEDIRNKIETIVVEKGITSLGESSFAGLSALKTVYLPSTLKSIGKNCFKCYSGAFSDIYIKDSVNSIDDLAFATGSYWIYNNEPVIQSVRFHCNPGSYADKYAAKLGRTPVYHKIELADKTCDFTGEPVQIDPASLTDLEGDVTYKYYTDKDCNNPCTSDDSGSDSKGSAPINVGTYYVKASVTDSYWGKVTSDPATLKIKKASGNPATSVLKVALNKASTASVACGNVLILKPIADKDVTFYWTSQDPSIAAVDESGKVTGVKAGTVTVTGSSSEGYVSCAIQVLYKDVTDPSCFWFEPTNHLTNSGVVKGYNEQTEFRPANNCTRAQMVTFIWRLAGCPKPSSSECRFTDVKKSDYFYKACLWGNEKHIVEGYKDGTFGPQIVCARRHAVTFLWRLAGKPDPKSSKNKFSDVKNTDYFYTATLWASEKGILAGYKDGTFRPDGDCLRRQMVTFLFKYDRFVNKKG